MAASKKYYVWAPIQLADGKSIAAGTVVTSKDVAEDWDALVESGAIKAKVYPKMPETYLGSPNTFRLEEIKRMQDDLDNDDLDDETEDEE